MGITLSSDTMKIRLILGIFATIAVAGADYTESHCKDKKQAIVHLFEWSWDSIANECINVLGPKGFCGVQVSPPNEHIQGSEWWTRYQPVSYKLESRSGNRDSFINMVNQCNSVGVMIIIDAVVNHMTGHEKSGQGTGGSGFNGGSQDYPGVPFSSLDFHQPYCEINNYGNADEVRNCYLVGLNDLDGGKDYVRQKIADYFNDLINIGVKVFKAKFKIYQKVVVLFSSMKSLTWEERPSKSKNTLELERLQNSDTELSLLSAFVVETLTVLVESMIQTGEWLMVCMQWSSLTITTTRGVMVELVGFSLHLVLITTTGNIRLELLSYWLMTMGSSVSCQATTLTTQMLDLQGLSLLLLQMLVEMDGLANTDGALS